jgi:hypothetical protein
VGRGSPQGNRLQLACSNGVQRSGNSNAKAQGDEQEPDTTENWGQANNRAQQPTPNNQRPITNGGTPLEVERWLAAPFYFLSWS